MGIIPGIARVAAPNGYLNVFLDRPAFLRARLGLEGALPAPPPRPEKTIVEHTAINPNKAAHIGHLRNSALGDTLVRVLRFRGTPVEVQNYIDDTGVQVADVVVGFQELERKDLATVTALAETTRFDYYCWDLYARVTEWYEQDKERLKIRGAALHAIEHGEEPAVSLGALIADRIVRCHLKTMARLRIDYELLTWEGDILRLKFWARAFEVLKEQGAVFLQTEGRLAGCWVMAIDEDPSAAAEGEALDEDAEQREKVIVRSNGTVTYVGKDMAYQFWKSGVSAATSTTAVRHAPGRRRPVGYNQRSVARRGRSSGVRRRRGHLQRDRRPAVLPAEAPEAGTRRRRTPGRGGASYSFLVRDGGAVARHGPRTRVRTAGRFGRGRQAVRRGIWPQGPGREGRRSHRPGHRQGPGRSRASPARAARGRAPEDRRGHRHRRRAVLPREVLAHQGHRLDIDEALSFEGESGPTSSTRSYAPTISSRSCTTARG
jgi:hypothetical protein